MRQTKGEIIRDFLYLQIHTSKTFISQRIFGLPDKLLQKGMAPYPLATAPVDYGLDMCQEPV